MIYNSYMRDEATGSIDFDVDTVFVVLLTSGYTPDKATHEKRSDLTDELVAAGYTAGGQEVDVTVAEVSGDRVEITLGGAIWNPATFTARFAVYYKNRGGDPADDELIYCNEFPTDISSTAGSFTVEASMIRKQN
jgi:hypothetical protein